MAEYRCINCNLVFLTGWHHFHDSFRDASITYLVCINCGTNHFIEHYKNPEENVFGSHASPICITNMKNARQDEPLYFQEEWSKTICEGKIQIPSDAAIHKDHFFEEKHGLLEKIKRKFMWGDLIKTKFKTWAFENRFMSFVGAISCAFCKEKRICAEYPFHELCPRCKETSLRLASVFMT